MLLGPTYLLLTYLLTYLTNLHVAAAQHVGGPSHGGDVADDAPVAAAEVDVAE